jgi:hypothetical protein
MENIEGSGHTLQNQVKRNVSTLFSILGEFTYESATQAQPTLEILGFDFFFFFFFFN